MFGFFERKLGLIILIILVAAGIGLIGLSANSQASGLAIDVAPTGSISGHVFQADGITPISGAWITVYSFSLPPVPTTVTVTAATTTAHVTTAPAPFVESMKMASESTWTAITDQLGNYLIEGITPGDYYLGASAEGFISQYYENSDSTNGAASVGVAPSNDTADIDFLLSAGGSISGRVFQSDGTTPISGAQVSASSAQGNYLGSDSTGSDGHYTIRGLGTAVYIVSVSAAGYLDQYYDNSTFSRSAEPVSVIAPDETANINFKLILGGMISGYVYQDDGTTPIPGARIEAWDLNFGYSRQAIADLTGSYIVKGLSSGSYYVTARAPGYLSEYYDGVSSKSAATVVSVIFSENTAGIDFTLDSGGSISGRVCQADGTTPISGASVQARGAQGGNGSAITDSNGNYTILGLMSDTYQVSASAADYLSEYYNGAAAPVAVSVPGIVPDINFSLDWGGTISGCVYQADGTTPISGALVKANGVNNNSGSATTGSDGNYIIRGLAWDNYRVNAFAPYYLTQYYNGLASAGVATPVHVVPPDNTSKIDFSLKLGGMISGRVLEADGTTPISGAAVRAEGMTSGYSSASTNTNGYYTIRGLLSDDYKVSATAAGYLIEYYNGASSSSARLVSVSAPNIVPDINFSLDLGGTLSGRVFRSDGITPISGAEVQASGMNKYSSVYTDTDGIYTLRGLVSDNYKVSVSARDYFLQYYNGVSSPDLATPVTVTAPGNTMDIDFTLELGGTISGHVYQTDGVTPILGAFVEALGINASGGNWVKID